MSAEDVVGLLRERLRRASGRGSGSERAGARAGSGSTGANLLHPDIGQITVEWLGACDYSAQAPPLDEVVKRSALQEAMEVLFLLLRDQPREAEDAFKKAREHGVTRRTLERAKVALGVKSGRVKSTWGWHWCWRLPENDNATLTAIRQKYESDTVPALAPAKGS